VEQRRRQENPVNSGAIRSRAAALAGGVGLIVMAALAAGCAGNTPPQPTSTTTTTTTSESSTVTSPSATEKGLQPSGGNLFTPDVKAPTAATVAPGMHPGINGVP
jgi:hypothetical protein